MKLMIYGIGVDLVSIKKIDYKFNRWGDTLTNKILSNTEKRVLNTKTQEQKSQYIAKCWAVKEAFVKAAGTGFGEFAYKDVSYVSPNIVLDENKYMFMKNKKLHLSLSDEDDMVVAQVVIETWK